MQITANTKRLTGGVLMRLSTEIAAGMAGKHHTAISTIVKSRKIGIETEGTTLSKLEPQDTTCLTTKIMGTKASTSRMVATKKQRRMARTTL